MRSLRAHRAAGAVLLLALTAACAGSADPPPDEQAVVPPTDCTADVGYPRNTALPGYAVDDGRSGRVCLPFTWIEPAPSGDFRIREFSFAASLRLLDECRAAPPCGALTQAEGYQPEQFRSTGAIDPVGKIDPLAATVDLRDIRRPAYFAREGIAAAEKDTYTVELAVPAEPYEAINRKLTDPVRLRGWYLRGAGVPDGTGGRVRALAILLGGRTIETTAAQDPADPLYTGGGTFTRVSYPSRGTEKWGARQWRDYLTALHRAGFDVLTFDKRGHGISGGISADNTLQQGLDMLRAVDALGDGAGLRVLGPDGAESAGATAVRQVLGDPGLAGTMPILLGGASQGAWATQWAMDANLHRWCAWDTPGRPCSPAWGHRNIRGAMMVSALWGLPFENPGMLIDAAAQAEVNHTIFQPTSEPLAGIGDWPATFIGRGLWDEYQGPLAAYVAYQRAGPHAELVFVRGPHSENEHGAANVAYLRDRLVRFAVGVATGKPVPTVRYATMRDAIAASPALWEPSTRPTTVE